MPTIQHTIRKLRGCWTILFIYLTMFHPSHDEKIANEIKDRPFPDEFQHLNSVDQTMINTTQIYTYICKITAIGRILGKSTLWSRIFQVLDFREKMHSTNALAPIQISYSVWTRWLQVRTSASQWKTCFSLKHLQSAKTCLNHRSCRPIWPSVLLLQRAACWGAQRTLLAIAWSTFEAKMIEILSIFLA